VCLSRYAFSILSVLDGPEQKRFVISKHLHLAVAYIKPVTQKVRRAIRLYNGVGYGQNTLRFPRQNSILSLLQDDCTRVRGFDRQF